MLRTHFRHGDGPSADDLAALVAQEPLIAAELDLLAAEINNLYAEERGGPFPMDWRRLRRAEARVTRLAAELAARPAGRLLGRQDAA